MSPRSHFGNWQQYYTLLHETPDGYEEETPLLVTYSYIRGRPATGPTYDCGGEPADPDEVNVLRIQTLGSDPVIVDLTDAEQNALDLYLLENHEE